MQHSYFSPMQLKTTKKSADEQNFDKMKAAYDACLNDDRINSVGTAALVEVLEAIEKAYPEGNAMLLLARYGVSTLVSVGTGADDTDPDTVVVSVSAPYSFGLPSKERYEDEKLVEKYRSVTVEVLSALYPNRDHAVFAKITELEKKLAAASPSSEDREDVTVSTITAHVTDDVRANRGRNTITPCSSRKPQQLPQRLNSKRCSTDWRPQTLRSSVLS